MDWDELSFEIRQRRVVPVIGPELLPYHRALARDFSQALGLAEPGEQSSIGDVADAYIAKGGLSTTSSKTLRPLLANSPSSSKPSEALRQLTSIPEFDLYITTDYLGLVEEALDCTFARDVRLEDVDLEYPYKGPPYVYHLLGQIERHRTVALARVEQLEYLYQFHSPKGPNKLLQSIRDRGSLLFLGCDFPEWIAGYFTRMLVGRPLDKGDDRGIEVVASSLSCRAPGSPLMVFLKNNSVRIFEGTAASFISELVDEYRKRTGDVAQGQAGTGVQPDVEGRIFVSYRREDNRGARAGHVTDLVANLKKEPGLKVWFEEQNIERGRTYESQIKMAIKKQSAIFMPVMSRNTLSDEGGFYRTEWGWANERLDTEDYHFVFPIIVDDSLEPTISHLKNQYPTFAKFPVAVCPGGKVDEALVNDLRSALKDFGRRRRERR